MTDEEIKAKWFEFMQTKVNGAWPTPSMAALSLARWVEQVTEARFHVIRDSYAGVLADQAAGAFKE